MSERDRIVVRILLWLARMFLTKDVPQELHDELKTLSTHINVWKPSTRSVKERLESAGVPDVPEGERAANKMRAARRRR